MRGDLRDDDIRREARTIREQVLAPMVAFALPGRDAPVPLFRRIKPETVDRLREAQIISSAQQTGIEVPEAWARKVLSIPKPAVDEAGRQEAILEPGLDAFAQGLGEATPAGQTGL